MAEVNTFPLSTTPIATVLQSLNFALYKATSVTSLLIGTGSKVFVTQSGKDFAVGDFVLATSDADETNYMLGQITAYSGTSLTVNVPASNYIGGSGTLADWTLRLSGPPGATGATGATGPTGPATIPDRTVRLATTANGTLASAFQAGQTIDGVVLVAGNLLLIKDQSAAEQNGVYVVQASGAPAREDDYDTYDEHPGAVISVQEGTANADTLWLCTSNKGGTLDTTAIAFTQVQPDASQTKKGIVELATNAEVQAGVDTVRAVTPAGLTSTIGVTVQAYDAQLSSLVRQNSQSAAYTLVLTDGGKHILHPSADTTARVFTIPANASVAFPIGTAVTFVNQNAGGVITISITTDTMRLAGAGTTGSRTLAANGVATALKITSTEWIISGTGLT